MITMVSRSQLSGFTWRQFCFDDCTTRSPWNIYAQIMHLFFCLFMLWVVMNPYTSVVFHQCVVVLNTLPLPLCGKITSQQQLPEKYEEWLTEMFQSQVSAHAMTRNSSLCFIMWFVLLNQSKILIPRWVIRLQTTCWEEWLRRFKQHLNSQSGAIGSDGIWEPDVVPTGYRQLYYLYFCP